MLKFPLERKTQYREKPNNATITTYVKQHIFAFLSYAHQHEGETFLPATCHSYEIAAISKRQLSNIPIQLPIDKMSYIFYKMLNIFSPSRNHYTQIYVTIEKTK